MSPIIKSWFQYFYVSKVGFHVLVSYRYTTQNYNQPVFPFTTCQCDLLLMNNSKLEVLDVQTFPQVMLVLFLEEHRDEPPAC